MPNDNSPLGAIAANVSRHVLHGSRQPDAHNLLRPLAVLTGQQQPASPDEMRQDIQFYLDGQPSIPFTNHQTDLKKTYDAVAATFAAGSQYYNLHEDLNLPTWVFHRKRFGVSALPVPEEVTVWAQSRVMRFSASILREAAQSAGGDTGPTSSARITLCRFKPDPGGVDTGTSEPVNRDLWRSAVHLRCGLAPAWNQNEPAKPIFELSGIPQQERWYLDQMDLLRGGALPEGSELRLLIQYRSENGPPLAPVPIDNWLIVRRNLTGIARPQTDLKADLADPYPYTADPTSARDALQLLQMASIVNSGGYYLRVNDAGFTLPATGSEIVLVVVVLLPPDRIVTPPPAEQSQNLPPWANAFWHDPANEIDVVRFEGSEHVQVEPLAAPGCVAIGLVRQMPWAAPPPPDPNQTHPEYEVVASKGFAESFHLPDIEIADSASGIIDQYTQTQTNNDGNASYTWVRSKCSGDSGSPLVPMDPASRGESNDNFSFSLSTRQGRIAAVAVDRPRQRTLDANNKGKNVDEHSYVYRAIVRYAVDNVYARLASRQTSTLKVTSSLRDLYGNRITPNDGRGCHFEKQLFYTDAMIPPAEWPGIELAMFANGVDHVTLQVLYKDPTSPHFLAADLYPSSLNSSLSGAQDSLGLYVRRRLEMCGVDPRSSVENSDFMLATLVRGFNEIIDGPCIYDDERFRHVKLSDETLALVRLHNRTPRLDRRLNRLLLDDAFAYGKTPSFAPATEDRSNLREQYLRKLKLVRDQLTGVGDDIQVSVLDANDNLVVAASPAELRAGLLELINAILAADGSPLGMLTRTFAMAIARKPSRTGVIHFSPQLQVIRTDHLPGDHDLPSDDAVLRQRISEQIRRAVSGIPFALAPNTLEVADEQFREIARSFRLSGSQSALARNIFNEHELWFVPDDHFPIPVDAPLAFSTPRPLSTKLGTDTFRIPDFAKPGSGSGQGSWHGFPLSEKPVTFSSRDFDDLGRSFFACVERLFQAQVITEQHCKELLGQKDRLSKLLAGPTVVVPMFTEDGGAVSPAPNSAAVQRTVLDTFQQDLRGFYRIDTVVGFPIQPRKTSQIVSNYYGRVCPRFARKVPKEGAPLPDPTTPRFSDLVLNVNQDWQKDNGLGYLTLTFDMPPGQEEQWHDWTTQSVQMSITHLQLAVSDQDRHHPFDQGQWLQLADDEAPVAKLTWSPAKPIPAIIRKFPDEPVLKQVESLLQPMERLAIPAGDFHRLTRWEWRVHFTGAYGTNDIVYLDVEYGSKDITETALRHPTVAPFSGLLQALIVGDALAKTYASWSVDYLQAGVDAAADLLGVIASSFESKKFLQERNTDFCTDSFLLPISGTPTPSENNELVHEVLFVQPSAGEFTVATVDRMNQLRLFGSTSANKFNARTMRPRLRLKRNEGIAELAGLAKASTNPGVVYECGPVIWPKRVPVSNVWQSVKLQLDDRPLVDNLSAAFASMLGDTDLGSIDIRVILKHSFDITGASDSIPEPPGALRQSNPFNVFPVDYHYGTPKELADQIVANYAAWLAKDGLYTATEVLQATANPHLQIGLQFAMRENTTKDQMRTGRVLLQIEEIDIDMTGVSPTGRSSRTSKRTQPKQSSRQRAKKLDRGQSRRDGSRET